LTRPLNCALIDSTPSAMLTGSWKTAACAYIEYDCDVGETV
jgi:hypothetical protein